MTATSSVAQLDLSIADAVIVHAVLEAWAPRPCQVYVFGSRVTGRANRFSDLDLALDAARPLSVAEQAALHEAFTESALPWRVDLVDLHAINPAFRSVVEATRRLLIDLPRLSI